MKNLYRFMAFAFLALALGIDFANTNLASRSMLAATCALTFCSLVFLVLSVDMRRSEETRSDLFTRRAHLDRPSTYECDGRAALNLNQERHHS